jgi:hypothetical protein
MLLWIASVAPTKTRGATRNSISCLTSTRIPTKGWVGRGQSRFFVLKSPVLFYASNEKCPSTLSNNCRRKRLSISTTTLGLRCLTRISKLDVHLELVFVYWKIFCIVQLPRSCHVPIRNARTPYATHGRFPILQGNEILRADPYRHENRYPVFGYEVSKIFLE